MKIYSYVELSDRCTKNLQKGGFFTSFVIFGPENYYYYGVFDKNGRKNIHNVEVHI